MDILFSQNRLLIFIIVFVIIAMTSLSVFTQQTDVTFAYTTTLSQANSSSIATSYTPHSYMTNYFYNLNDYAQNTSGTCGYIALQMLLSFYNHYWNDNIIPEAFETTSTLNYSNNSASPGTIDDFHTLLLSIGHSLGYSDALNADTGFSDVITAYFNNYSSDSIKNWTISSFYNHYPENPYPNTNITYSQYYANNIKRLVKSGIPTIVYIHEIVDGEELTHACIAFDYDDTLGRLIFKTGWHSNHISTLEREDNCIIGYCSLLNIYSPHIHSTNYTYNEEPCCSCQLPDHEHTFTYTSNGTSGHTCTCYCGNSEHQEHSFVINNIKY